MAIRIPILTSFDPKGLKQANASFATLQSSVSSLGRNFATAGIAIGAIGAGLAKTVQTASSYAESVNAVNVAFGKSAQGIIDFGKTAATTLGVSQVDFNNAAVRFSAFAERIVGSGGDASKFIAEISTRASDFASVFNIDVSEALQVFQSGLAGEAEPLKRFGINLLDSEVKAYAAANGIGAIGKELTETEKVQARYGLLLQATSKTQGDFANTSDGLANQLRILKAEVSNTQIEIGNQLLPVMAELLPIVRDLVSELGTQLVAAVKAVDWKGLTTDLMNSIKFFVDNATAIANLTIAIFAINTAYKTFAVLSGIATVATNLYTWSVAQATAGTKLATTATTLFSVALRLIPIVAIISGLALLVAAFTNTNEWAGKAKGGVVKFGDELEAVGGKVGILRKQLDNIPKEVTTTYTFKTQTAGQVASSFGGTAFDAQTQMFKATQISPIPTPGGAGPQVSALDALLADANKNAKVTAKEAALVNKGLSASVAAWVTTSSKPIAAANQALKDLASKPKATVKKLTAGYNKSAAGQQAVAQAAQAAAESAAQAAQELAAAQAAAAAAEAAALAERERVYQSFADSVKNTFAGIKNSITGAFDLTQLGGSTNAITRNMEKLLTRLRSFATNVKNLATMGLNPALLQQVISAGPIAGARLAESLAMGGAGGLSAINAGYAEFGALSGQIAQTGTESLFGTGAQQSVYNINVDGGVGSGSTIGKAIVDAIKAYERTSGAVWQGA
jgi:hypothetical protein